MKTNSRKFLSLFLAVIMMISVIPLGAVTVTAQKSGDFEYNVISEDDKTCEIKKYNGTATELDIPSELDGYTVAVIGSDAFRDYTALVSVIIPNSVKVIGVFAFCGCSSLTDITIPDSVSIGYSAFAGTAYYNTESNWENDVLYIGNHLIKAKSHLDSEYNIKEGTKTIADQAFYYCTSLTSITIPDSMTSIGHSAFEACNSLISIELPDSVTSISSNVFSDTAYYNTESNWENDVLYIGNHLIRAKSHLDSEYSIEGEYNIKEGTKTIADQAFYYCSSLTNVTIPDSVTSISDSAFAYCSALTNVTIPDSITNIDENAFNGCRSLTNITIPAGIKSIGFSSFSNCKSLTSITIPDSVTNIGGYAFSGCDSLTSITIPNSITSIDGGTFDGCTSLTSITIPDSVTNIGDYAFSNCTSLKGIAIPDNVTSIGYSVFENCTSLESINVGSKNTEYSSLDGALFNNEKTVLIQYPTGKQDREYTIPNSVTSIDNRAFDGCRSLTSITIPAGIKSIGFSSFSNCKSLTSITIPDSVTNIGGYAFSGCTSLTSIIIPDSITSIDSGAFDGCTSLTSITIPDSVTNIGDNAFSGCTSLTSIIIPDSVTSIGDNAFLGCTSLKSISIPNSVTSIGWKAIGYYATYDDTGRYLFKIDGFTIYGYTDSSVEKYANEENIPFIALDALINTENNISVIFPNEDMRESEITLNVNKLNETENAITYDIKLTENDTEIQPQSTVTVKIPVPDTMNGEDCKVYRAETDGTYTDMNAVYSDGFMIFTTDHFSEYVLIVEKSEKTILKRYKDQIRFQKNDDGTYAGKFDYRTLAMISKGDFIDMFGSEENAVKMIQEIGFVYAATTNVPDFNMDFAKSMVENIIEKDSGYVKVPVNYISTAFSDKDGQNADYVISCIITNVDDANVGIHSMAYIKYTDSNGDTKYVYYDTVEKSEFKTLFDKNFAIAFPEV